MKLVLRIALPLLAIGCLALVGTIEVLNVRAGHAIERKQEQEPHSKWRISSQRAEWMSYQRDFRAERGIGLGKPLTSAEAVDFQRYAVERWQENLPHHRMDVAIRGYAAWGIPLGALAGLSLLRVLRERSVRWRSVFLSSAILGIGTFLVTLLRYLPALGW